MTVHCCRDLVVGSTGSYSSMYALACFMQGVLGFTQVGASGRNEWIQNLLPIALQTGGSGGGDSLASVGGVGVLTLAGAVGSWANPIVCPQGGVDYILAIKSNTYPLVNSGLYRITSVGSNTISFDTRTFDSGSVPYADANFTWTVFPPVESVFNDLDVPINTDPDADGDVDTQGWDNNPQAYNHVYSGLTTVQSHPRVDSPAVSPPTNPTTYNFTNDLSLNPNENANGVDTLDDYFDYHANKARFYYVWSLDEWKGDIVARTPNLLQPNAPTYNPEYITTATPSKTIIASLLDRPAFNNTPDDGHYHGQGSYDRLRVIYQSPHPTGWQVRLCLESAYDTGDSSSGGACNGVTLSIAPGFSGSGGDFATGFNGGRHLHGALWYNTASSSYRGLTIGLNPDHAYSDHVAAAGTLGNDYASHGQYVMTSFNAGHLFPFESSTNDYRWRMYIWGDDVTGAVVVCNRGYFNASDEFAAFGIPEDETVPLPPDPVQRLFVVGQSNYSQGVDWRTGTYQDDGISGVAYSLDLRRGPISCALATYNFVSTQGGNNNGIRFDSAAGDTPFLEASELLPVDLIAGGRDTGYVNSSGPEVIRLETRRMGRFPIARIGRANVASWTTADSGNLWFHATNGFYLPWGGIRPMS